VDVIATILALALCAVSVIVAIRARPEDLLSLVRALWGRDFPRS
jgi:hypothetical protein